MVAALFVLSLITYIDRAAISTAKGPMASGAPAVGRARWAGVQRVRARYAAAQIPSGWLADRIGPRRALAIVVVLWSLLTSLTGAMTGLARCSRCASCSAWPRPARFPDRRGSSTTGCRRPSGGSLTGSCSPARCSAGPWRFPSAPGCSSTTAGAARSTCSASLACSGRSAG